MSDKKPEKGPVAREAKRTIDYDVRFPYTVEIPYDEKSDRPWFARVVELLGCMTGARRTLKENYENAGGVAPQYSYSRSG